MQSAQYIYSGIVYTVSISDAQPGFPWCLEINQLGYVEFFSEQADCHEAAESEIFFF